MKDGRVQFICTDNGYIKNLHRDGRYHEERKIGEYRQQSIDAGNHALRIHGVNAF